MGFCSRWKFPTQGMTVLSGTEAPPRVIPRVGNFHLEKNTILDSFSCTTTPKIWFISRFCVIFGALNLGKNTWVRCNFITQAKSVAISVWCARISIPTDFKWEHRRILQIIEDLSEGLEAK